ncbi:DUF485 domain-containing protein [Propionibacteriaceae bacterium Y1685]|uniref:DUF485 domain-containing protein n=1 Tax=Microlunatus sp. Y1700 TaxID=3418487 RepID=UPI003B7E310E
MTDRPDPIPDDAPAAVTEVTDAERAAYAKAAGDQRFAELRSRYRGFAFPATIAFMVWYIVYVLCNNWARDFMAIQVVGHINVALVFGLLQFVSTFAIAYFYSRHANKTLDPLATELRNDFEAETGRAPR